MKLFLTNLIALLSMNVFAYQVDFCLEGHLVNTATDRGAGSMSCKVEQSVSLSDASAFIDCSFGRNNRTIFSRSLGIGINHQTGRVWTEYLLNYSNDLGRFFLNGLGITDLKIAQPIELTYASGGRLGIRVWNSKPSIFIEARSATYELHYRAYLGECTTFTAQ